MARSRRGNDKPRTSEKTAEPTIAVSASGAALDAFNSQADSPGFGETDTTEVTGDATYDQDMADEAGDVGGDELAGGQEEVDAYRERNSGLAAPSDGGGGKTPAIKDPGAAYGLSGGTSQGGGGSAAVSAGGGSESQTDPSAVTGGGGLLASGADAVTAAGGQQKDLSYLMGDPRDQVSSGGGNAAAADSDAYHAALGAVTTEQMNTRMSATSVADDGGALADAIAAADKEAPKAPGSGSPDLTKFQKAGDGMTAEEANEAASDSSRGPLEAVFEWISGERTWTGDASAPPRVQQDFKDVDGFGKVDKTTQVEGAKAAGVQNLETAMATALGSKKGGGVKDPGPDGEEQSGPPTEAEQALRAATNKLLGRNDALVHGPATQINPGEQGEVFQHGDGDLPTSKERGEAMFGQPAGPDGEAKRTPPQRDPAGPAPGVGQGPDQGGDIDKEDGSGYTGPMRQQGPEDVQFGTPDPLIGLEGGTGDDEEEDDDDGGKAGRSNSPALTFFDDDD